MTKVKQRKKLLARRDNLSPRARAEKSRQIKKYLFAQPEFKEASRIMFYVAFRSEVATKAMIEQALELGKEIVVPITNSEEKTLQLSLLTDYEQELEPGTYGILEPKAQYRRLVKPQTMDLLVVPGSGFDKQGNRLGYGGGYYDRLFAAVGNPPKLAIAFAIQIVAEIKTEAHDISVDKVITEQGVINNS
ncbi:5-formyltetrahydrofolate cyclo-ligase [Halanaerobaculum tunisiense]